MLNDGSSLENLQIVFPSNLTEKLKGINFGSYLIVSGKLLLTPERTQNCELQAQKIELINPTAEDYPLQRQKIPLGIVRNFPHLRAKTNYLSLKGIILSSRIN